MNDTIYRQAAINELKFAQHRFTVSDEAGGFGTVKWSEDVIYLSEAEKVLADLPSAQPDLQTTCNQLATDCISRQSVLSDIESEMERIEKRTVYEEGYGKIGFVKAGTVVENSVEIRNPKEIEYRDLDGRLKALDAIWTMVKTKPSEQPEITDEQAIEHLQLTGWMQNHDREMYDMGFKEQLADDSGSYDSLLQSAQPDVPDTNVGDMISRQAAIDWLINEWDGMVTSVFDGIKNLPAAQSEQRWIPCSERMPEEHEWMGTKKFGTTISDEVYVTFENPKGERFCKHLSFQNGKLSNFDQSTIDAFYKGSKPIAWMPLPEPYSPDYFSQHMNQPED